MKPSGTTAVPRKIFAVKTAIRIAPILACCAVAFAQWDPGATASLGAGYGRIALSQSILGGTRGISEAAASSQGTASRPASAPTPRVRVTLTYVADPQVSDRVRGTVINALSRQNPALRPALERAFANDEVLRNFDSSMRSRGWSSHDVADDVVYLLLLGWADGTGHDPTDAQIKGVRQQVRGVLLEAPQLRALTNTDRQMLGETMAYQVTIISLAYQQSKHTGDPAQLAQLKQSALAMVKQYGIDFTQVTLTDHGFVQRDTPKRQSLPAPAQ